MSKPRPIIVLGAGVLGCRIASVLLAGGHLVNLRDPSADALTAAGKFIESHRDEFRAIVPAPSSKSGNYRLLEDLSTSVQNAWLVIECVPERLELKISTFGEVDRYAPGDCIIASNSSSYKSRQMLDDVRPARRERVLNMHFTMPPAIRTVELMTDGETLPELFPQLSELLRECGMIPVTAQVESTGFIFNRIWAAIKREILLILAEGVSTPAEIDLLWREMFQQQTSSPPCRLMDQISLDTVAFIEYNYINERKLDGSQTVDWLRKNYLSQGRLGLKSETEGGLYDPSPALYVLDVGLGANESASPSTGRILRFDLTTKSMRPIVTEQHLPDGISCSKSTRQIFWTNMGASTATHDGSVQAANLDGSNVRTVVPAGVVHTPKQLIVDDKTQRLYFCDREGMAVHRCNFDGSDHVILVQTGDLNDTNHKSDKDRWCVGVAIDLDGGYLYWTQKGPSKGGSGRIFRADLELPVNETALARTDIRLILENLPEPIDLEWDPKSQTLYWTDRGEHPTGCSLNALVLDGKKNFQPEMLKEQVRIMARHFNEPIGLKIGHGGSVYVADLGGSLYVVDGGNKSLLWRDETCYTGLTTWG